MKDAGERHHNTPRREFREMSGVDLWRFARRSYERIFAKVENKEGILVVATVAWVRAHATDTYIQFLDCRNPGMEREFLNALQEHQPREERRHQFLRDPQRTRLWCQTCHKSGPRTQDCWHGNKSPSHAIDVETNNSQQTQPNEINKTSQDRK